MDIRAMRNYLAVVREGTISGAAEALHMAQPALSRQMRDLERELDVTLFVRGNRRIALTAEGMALRKRAEEMMRLVQITEDELSRIKNSLTGSIRIGSGESGTFHCLSRAVAELLREYPDVRVHVVSGDTQDLIDDLDNGLIDFAVIFTDVDHSVYQSLALPVMDRFGLIMPKGHPLEAKDVIELEDLRGVPVIVSRATEPFFVGTPESLGLNIVGTYNQLHNAADLVEDGACCALSFDGLVGTGNDSPFSFRPFARQNGVAGMMIWKKYQVLSRALQLFIEKVRAQAMLVSAGAGPS